PCLPGSAVRGACYPRAARAAGGPPRAGSGRGGEAPLAHTDPRAARTRPLAGATLRRDDPDLPGRDRGSRWSGGVMSRVAVFPGSFDPMTNAHLDVARRAAALFDRLVIGVLSNPRKSPLFAVDERIAQIRAAVRELGGNVEVDGFDGLTVGFA